MGFFNTIFFSFYVAINATGIFVSKSRRGVVHAPRVDNVVILDLADLSGIVDLNTELPVLLLAGGILLGSSIVGAFTKDLIAASSSSLVHGGIAALSSSFVHSGIVAFSSSFVHGGIAL